MGAGHDTASQIPAICPNCDHALATDDTRPKYCPDCGQATTLHAPSFFEFVHEFVGHYIALEGSLWRTLGNLIFRPGQLTVAYLRGQRQRYVLPLRVFLSASFVFFFVVKVLGVHSLEIDVHEGGDARAEIAAEACEGPDSAICAKAKKAVLEAIERDSMDPRHKAEARQRMASLAPYVIFALVPLSAGLVQLGYRNRRRNFGEHFVYALHQHAFVYLAMLAAALIPSGLALLLMPLVAAAHGILSLHRTYGGRWWTTFVRAGVIATMYLVTLGLVTGAAAWLALRSSA